MTAVEMRTDPVQCNFQPMFDPNAPALCGPGFDTNTVWKEDFEDGLAGWADVVRASATAVASTHRGRPAPTLRVTTRVVSPTARHPTRVSAPATG